MMQTSEVQEILQQGLPGARVEVAGDGQHFEAVVISDRFEGLSPLQRQRIVNAVVQSYMDSGQLHALSSRQRTPDEWAREQGQG